MSGAARVSMGDPVKALSLRQRIAWSLYDPRFADGATAPAYDVGRGVVMLTPGHRLHATLFERATAAALSSTGRVDDSAGELTTCQHLEGVGDAAADVHLVAFDPQWALCPPCARAVLAQWVGERRRCVGCEVDDVGDRLRLVRVPSAWAQNGSLVDAWALLCPRCLGPVAVA